MKRVWKERLILLALVGAGGATLQAQQVVHAVSGVVVAVDPAKNLISLKTNDDSEGDFKYRSGLKTNIEFDKSVREGTSDPSGFHKIGDHAVAYYFTEGAGRTIVALKDFGPNGLKVESGTLVKLRHRAITIKTKAGAADTFEIAKDASAETPEGVVSGLRFEAENGAAVTVRYTGDGDQKQAEFIRTE